MKRKKKKGDSEDTIQNMIYSFGMSKSRKF